MVVSQKIITWYRKNARILPWRKTRDPYRIWLSEIILQQTRVTQGLPYYNNFIQKFPNVKSLASAQEKTVMKTWQGLGYYTRAGNLHKTSKIIVNQYNEKFPPDYNAILKLPGIGPYTAAAIASFAFNLPFPVVDGNVKRFLSRYFGIGRSGSIFSVEKKYLEKAQQMMSNLEPCLFNQAIMEFGALQCVPRNPVCDSCIIKHGCFAFNNNLVGSLPVRVPKKKLRSRYFNYFLLCRNGKTAIRKRTEDDILKNLYEFPMIETNRRMSSAFIKNSELYRNLFRYPDKTTLKPAEFLVQRLSHQVIHASFWNVAYKERNGFRYKNWIWVPAGKISNYPVPGMIEKFLRHYKVG
ncbi:MAG: A/G-specific adenine glycosylase [Bacteroidetes bacterium]|nr:A/G-specific adenine glycosylase [Bacteroidota bacterium]